MKKIVLAVVVAGLCSLNLAGADEDIAKFEAGFKSVKFSREVYAHVKFARHWKHSPRRFAQSKKCASNLEKPPLQTTPSQMSGKVPLL